MGDGMRQVLDALAGLDPTGDVALLLCASVAVALGLLLVVGFGLLGRPGGVPAGGATRRAPAAADLDVVALWRLTRAVGKRGRPRPAGSSPIDSGGTTP
jgi:hypothetical protein